MELVALARFFQVLGTLVTMRNGGVDNDLSRLLNYARMGALAGDKGREHLKAAVAKVEQLVAEDRSLTDEELADLDAAIKGKLARAAAVELPDPPEHHPV
jgi:hypothetical protein